MNPFFHNKTFRYILSLFMILCGNFLVAFGVSAFIMPCGLISGGCTGVALFINHIFGLRVSSAVFLINIGMFLFGLILLGRKFALGTLLSSILYPTFLRIMETSMPAMTTDLMLATIFGGLFVGLGVGIVFKAGASTGGTDPIPLVLNKYFRIPLNASVYAVDFVIILLQFFFSEPESILYGVIFVFLSSYMVGWISKLGEVKVQVLAISKESSKIRETILDKCDLGATMLMIETGYNQTAQKAVMTVTRKHQLRQLENAIMAIDPSAFIQVTEIAAAYGRGFTLAR